MKYLKKDEALSISIDELKGQVVFTWGGKAPFLPYLDQGYFVTGMKGDMLLCTHVESKPSDRKVFVRRTDVALVCDAYAEYDLIISILKDYMSAKQRVDTHYAGVLTRLVPKSLEIAATKIKFRQRTRAVQRVRGTR